jgi:hypothetical protein
MSSSYKRHVPTVVVRSCKKKTDPLLDLLSVQCGPVAERTLVSDRTTRVKSDPTTTRKENSGEEDGQTNIHEKSDNESIDKQRTGEDAPVKVKARRRLLKRNVFSGAQNLASLAAQAGAHAAHEGSPVSVKPTEQVRGGSASSSPDGNQGRAKKPTRGRKKVSASDATARRTYRKKNASKVVIVNGAAIPSIVGVPDSLIVEMASLAPADRPVRCGVCRSCENPARKKACEVMRALGSNPPIPRGKNRVAILGPENTKKHISRTCEGPLNISPGTGAALFGTLNGGDGDDGSSGGAGKGDIDGWTEEELQCLYQSILEISPNTNNFWQKVAMKVPNRNEAECFAKMHENVPYYSGNSNKKKNSRKSKVVMALDPSSDDYVSNLLEQRRERALGHLASSGCATLQGSAIQSIKSKVQNDSIRELISLSHEDSIQALLLDQRKDGEESSPSRETWSEEF